MIVRHFDDEDGSYDATDWWLTPEQVSLMASMGAHAAGQPDGTAQLLRFAIASRQYWQISYGREEAPWLLPPVLQRADASANPALLAEVLIAVAGYLWAADLAVSVQLAEQADQIASQLGDNRLLAMSRAQLSWCYIRSGDYERARLLGQESVQRAREAGDEALLVDSLAHYAASMNTPEAMTLYEEAIACCERAGDVSHYYALHVMAGSDALWYGDVPAARSPWKPPSAPRR